MTLPDFVDRFVEFELFLGNALVFVLTIKAYQRTDRRCLLLIAISAAIGSVLGILPWMRGGGPSWMFWGFWIAATLADLALWVVGLRSLVREYGDMVTRIVQPDGAGNSHRAGQ